MTITVRPAAAEDLDTIADFNTRMAWETEKLKLDSEPVRQGVHGALVDPCKGLYFIADCDGQAAGQLMITHEWSDWRNGDIWWIQSVYVHPDFRRRGILRALIEHVQTESRRAGAVAVRLYVEKENRVAQQSYQKL